MEWLNSVCLLVRMTTPLEFVSGEPEDVPFRKGKAKSRNGLFYIVLNEKQISTSIASLSPLQDLVESRRFLHLVNCFSLTIWSQNQQVEEMQMEENKTLSLVLPENWYFLRGDIKGFQVQII